MTKLDKLIDEIIKVPNDMRFNEVKKVLEHEGYKVERPGGGSSHCIFRKEGSDSITIPDKNPVKRIYVKAVKKIVEGKKNE